MSNAKVRYRRRRRRRRAKRGPSTQEQAVERKAKHLADYFAGSHSLGVALHARIAAYGTTDDDVEWYLRHGRAMRRRDVEHLIAQVS